MMRFVIDYYAIGETHPGDCHPDFASTFLEAETIARGTMAEADHAIDTDSYDDLLHWPAAYAIRRLDGDEDYDGIIVACGARRHNPACVAF